MSALTVPAALALAASCGGGIDPTLLVGIARTESGLNPAAIHENRKPDGTVASRDWGLMQINDKNFDLLGLDEKSAMDPCRSITAAANLLMMLSRYNTGSPSRGIVNRYAGNVVQAASATRVGAAAAVAPPEATAAACPETDPTGWHVIVLPPGCDAGGMDDGWRATVAEAAQ